MDAPSALAKANWETLVGMRRDIPPDDPRQAAVAPY